VIACQIELKSRIEYAFGFDSVKQADIDAKPGSLQADVAHLGHVETLLKCQRAGRTGSVQGEDGLSLGGCGYPYNDQNQGQKEQANSHGHFLKSRHYGKTNQAKNGFKKSALRKRED
jgi:hypothetical protein